MADGRTHPRWRFVLDKVLLLILATILVYVGWNIYPAIKSAMTVHTQPTRLNYNYSQSQVTQAPPQPIVHKVNEDVLADKLLFKVLEVKQTTKIPKTIGGYTSGYVQTVNTYIAVKVRITNNDTKARKIHSGIVVLTDSQGRRFNSDGIASQWLNTSSNNKFGGETMLNPGLSLEGYIAYEVPKDTKGYKVWVFNTVENPDGKSQYQTIDLGI